MSAWHQRKQNLQHNKIASRLDVPFPTCQKSYATQASWKQPLPVLVEIWRNTTQFGEYKMVHAYATTADTQSTHRAVANVVTVTRNGLNL